MGFIKRNDFVFNVFYSGWKGLSPPLTVVRANPPPPLSPSDFLPTVSTCFHYLKLPEYSDKEILKEKLLAAIESKSRFHFN
jgi:E3 ubiquitin-protein ligase TRIP12